MEALARMEELFNTDTENEIRDKAKEDQSTNDLPKIMNCLSAPELNLGGGAVTEVRTGHYLPFR